MDKIKKDFMVKEFHRLALCAIGLAACLHLLLRCYPQLASYQPLPLLGMIAIVGLAALRSAIYARIGISALTDDDIRSLDREYAAPHPVCKVWQGEIHLLPSVIVCRNRGRLLCIPTHKIERVERRFNHSGMRKVPFAKFIMDTERSVAIGFSSNHAEESEIVFAWLEDHIGREKVRR